MGGSSGTHRKITGTGPFWSADLDPALLDDDGDWNDPFEDDFLDEDEDEEDDLNPLDLDAAVHVWLTPDDDVFLVGYTHGGSTVRQQLLAEVLHDEAMEEEWEDRYDADPSVLVGVVQVPDGEDLTEELLEGVQTLLLRVAIRLGNPVAKCQREDQEGVEFPKGLVVHNVVPEEVDVDLGTSEIVRPKDIDE